MYLTMKTPSDMYLPKRPGSLNVEHFPYPRKYFPLPAAASWGGKPYLSLLRKGHQLNDKRGFSKKDFFFFSTVSTVKNKKRKKERKEG